MSDMTLIAEEIINTMQVADEAFQLNEKLRKNTKLVAFDAFHIQMSELHNRLSRLKTVLDNEEAFAIDELVDALSFIHSGHRAEYRKTPRMNK